MIAATAVGAELAIHAASTDHALEDAMPLLLALGPAAFLLALAAIHAATVGRWDVVATQRAIAIGVLACLTFLRDPVLLSALVASVLVVTAVLDIRRAGGVGLAASEHAADRPVP